MESPHWMRLVQALLSVALITSCSTHQIEKRESNEKRIVCYYTNWSVYRPGTAKYNPQNINPYLCTHLIYAFGGLDRENGLRPYDKYQDIEQGGYAKFTGLKTYNKALKTMLAIGGWNEGSARFSSLVADEDRRAEFVKNVVKFLRQNHFDGLDLDWEYPAFRDGGKPRDRDNYAQLVQELREEFDREHSKTGRPRLLLTMAVPAGIEYIDKGYDIPKLNRYLDFMNILSYDYHSAFEPAVNHHSPLYPLEEEGEYNFDAQLSIDYTIKHYLKLGADRDKLVLGIPTYGRSYTLYNPESTDLGAPADGPGDQGDATREKGYLAYYEICGSLKSGDDWVVRQPKRGAMGPYAYNGNQWVGYDDVDIVQEKAQYVNEKGLGGIMFWSIDNDDFRGVCHDRPYPLIEAGKEALLASSGNNDVSSPVRKNKPSRPSSNTPRRPLKSTKPKTLRTTTTTTPVPPKTPKGSLTTPEPPTTPDPGSDFVCKDEGFFPHPRDCKKYFWCLDSGPSNLGIVAHQFTCPSGLYFNKAADSCDYTRNVICNKKEKEKPTTKAPKITPVVSKSTSSHIKTTTTTTTTTTEAPVEEIEEEEEEYYEDHAEEDPQAIKQLIQLIKKLGGVAELEKQLEGAGGSDSTPPPIPRSLYNKVITPKQRYQSSFVNGPSGPQNEGLSEADDGSPYSRREKPQYVTIRRERPSTEAPKQESNEDAVDNYEISSSRPKYQTLERTNIRTSQSPSDEYETEEATRANTPRYSTIQRNRPVKVDVEEEEEEESDEDDKYRPKYTSIQRSRPTTEELPPETTTSRYITLRRQRPQIEKDEPENDEMEEHVRGTTIKVSEEPEEDLKEIKLTEDSTTTTSRPKIKVSPRETLFLSMTSDTKPVSITVTTDLPSNTNTATSDLPTVYNRFATLETTLDADIQTIPHTSSKMTTNNPTVPNSLVTAPLTTTAEIPSTVTVLPDTVISLTSTTEIPTIYTLTTESNTEVTDPPSEPSTTAPTTVPYQTSTITRVVTMIVEGATERQRIPVNKLQEAIAKHNFTRYASTNLLEPVKAKEQQLQKNISEGNEKKDIKSNKEQGSITNQYKPRSNYRGRIKKPLNIEPPTTKSLPLYLSRRRTTTTEASEIASTEESQPTKSKGRFIPSRSRGRGRGKGSSSTTEIPIKESFTVRSRTRPSRPAGSRFSSRSRTKTTTPTTLLDENEEDLKVNVDDPEDIRKELSIKNQGNGYSFLLDTEPVTERPKFVPRGRPSRTSTTTEETISKIEETTLKTYPPTRSRFILSRGRTRLTTQRPIEDNKRNENESRRRKIPKENLRDNKDIFKTNSRFKIDRQRKTSVSNESRVDEESTKSIEFEDQGRGHKDNTFDIEKEEILISQENSNGKTNLNSLQTGINYTNSTQLKSQNKLTLYPNESHHFKNASGYSFNVSVLVPNENITDEKITEQNLKTNEEKTDSFINSSQSETEEGTHTANQDFYDNTTSVATSSNTNLGTVLFNTTISSLNQNTDVNNITLKFVDKNPTNISVSTDKKQETNNTNSFTEYDEEDLNLIASLYMPQSYTGRGEIQFSDTLDKGPKIVSRKDNVRNLKNSVETQNNNKNEIKNSEVLGKSSENSNFRKTGRRKVLVRKNKTIQKNSGITEGLLSSSNDTKFNTQTSRQRGPVRAKLNNTNISNLLTNGTNSFRNRSRVKKIIVRNRNHSNGTSEVQSILKESDQTPDLQKKRRRILIKNNARNNTTIKRVRTATPNDSDDLIDLDVGTSLYVDRKTESNNNEGEFNRVRAPNELLKGKNKDVKLNRGKLKAKDSLLSEDVPISKLAGVNLSKISEDYYDETGEEQTVEEEKRPETEKIGVTRLRAGFRKPGTVSVSPRSRSTTTTEATIERSEKPTAKYIRRRVNKFRIEPSSNGTSSKVQQETITEKLVLQLTTQKPRKFEFPRRTIKPNSLPTASPLLATRSPPIVVQDFEDNHSDESLHDVDTEIVESKEAATEEFLDGIEEVSRLPDLANVAVAAIQSLATSPPSTETIATTTLQQTRRPLFRTVTTTTTTTARPKPSQHRGSPRPFAKVHTTTPPSRSSYITKNNGGSYDTPDYEDYYAEPVDIPLSGKVRIHNDGYIECLDIGNFPHPFSCKKFISCAKMENGHLLGWEYTCPKGLSFDPIGGICNWSAGLGCKE